MSCALCKGNLTTGKVNHIIDLGNGIIIIKDVPANICNQCGEYYVETQAAIKLEEIVDELRKNRAEVLIINFNEMVA
ncbi:MAG TPA: type II toxin-antitoxin system MqsA family antitoxin [Epulopiscium sp.]|nr:type II toxin-antitoxin system MqsA family antitoxin [Candidatus Epulonipiscium sp.]